MAITGGAATLFQSTRPCGARHDVRAAFESEMRVSIHAPVWGATAACTLDIASSNVSIHAPVWGATNWLRLSWCWHQSFNPRARVGRDASPVLTRWAALPFQSTRPCGARPATNPITKTAERLFQSTRPCGARRVVVTWLSGGVLFQSTRPCGARRAACGLIARLPRCFNPRARVGRDQAITWGCWVYGSFQSTRPCGARQSVGEGGTGSG